MVHPVHAASVAGLRPPGPAPESQPVASQQHVAAFEAALDRATTARSGAPPAVTGPAPASTRREVVATRTRLTGDDASAALAAAYERVTGKVPSRKTVAVLTAQWSHETGRGRSMYNFNFGGVKGHGPSGMTTKLRTREGWGKNEVTIRDGFRAYASAEEGATDYVSLLARRYAGALERAGDGDPEGFVRSLKGGGYFTGNEEAYVRSVRGLTEAAMNQGFDAIGAGGSYAGPAPAVVASDPGSGAVPSTARRVAAMGRHGDLSLSAFSYDSPGVYVDARALGAELSRAALRIAANRDDRERG